MLGSTPPSPSLSVAGWQRGSTSDAGRVLSVSSLSPGVSVPGQTEPPAASSFVPLVCAECSAEEEERERGKGGRKREGEERGRKKGGGGGEVIHSHSCIHYLHLCLVIMSVFFLGVYRLCEQNEQNKTRVTCTLVTISAYAVLLLEQTLTKVKPRFLGGRATGPGHIPLRSAQWRFALICNNMIELHQTHTNTAAACSTKLLLLERLHTFSTLLLPSLEG